MSGSGCVMIDLTRLVNVMAPSSDGGQLSWRLMYVCQASRAQAWRQVLHLLVARRSRAGGRQEPPVGAVAPRRSRRPRALRPIGPDRRHPFDLRLVELRVDRRALG